MGFIAHDFSNNKLRFLEVGHASFESALRCLPLPYASTEQGCYSQPELSPLFYAQQNPSSLSTEESREAKSLQIASSITHCDSACSIYSIDHPATLLAPPLDSNGCPLATCPDMTTGQEGEEIRAQAEPESLTPPCTPSSYKCRLSQSLSSTHVLDEKLVPTPLFRRAPKHASSVQGDTSSTLRPLPPLPFNHRLNFAIQGSRIVQLPTMRKTAVQTLIAQYEGILPLSPPQPQLRSPEQTCLEKTSTCSTPPVTPRFKLIRDAFSPNPHNENLEAYLSSASLARYNTSLSDFRSQLLKHTAFLRKAISGVLEIQTERNATKTLSKRRFASFWSFEHRPALTKGGAAGSNRGHNAEEDGDEGQEDPACNARRERIEKLRREGWRVRKEKHGFKGAEWYEGFRSRVAGELDDLVMKTSRTTV